MRILISCLLLASYFLTQQASAFTLFGDGKELKGWDTKVLAFHLNPSNCPSNVQALLDEALTVWNQVPSSGIQVERGDETDTSLEQALAGAAPETPTIHCATNMAALGANPSIIPGFATGFGVNAQRHVVYGVLVLNAVPGANANIAQMDEDVVVDVMAHEIGHILGLGHTPDTTALMYYDASRREKASLSQDDVDGITYLYPRDELGEHKPLGCGSLLQSGANTTGTYLLLLLPLLAIAVQALLRRFFLMREGQKKS